MDQYKIDIKSLELEELHNFIDDLGEKKFRAVDIFGWLHKKHVSNFSQMTSLSKNLVSKLDSKTYISYAKIIKKVESKEDKTIKYLFQIGNNYIIESVFMRYSFGNTVCVSTQIGCRMGCRFCASTINGLERNLSAGEILSQVYEIIKDTGEKVSNIVLMGSGEPFDNYDNCIKFVKIINSEKGLNIGQRHITISTCGLVEKIIQFADEELQVNLAISLHATNDYERQKIMPIANKYSLEKVLEACRYFIKKTNRRVTFEYALIDGVNDSEKFARELASLLKGMLCHVNLISINPVNEKNYKKSDKKSVKQFAHVLQKNGIEITIRRELGNSIDAACGQLRNRYLQGEN